MPNLRFLRMSRSRLGRFPPPSASHWEGVTNSKSIALLYVQYMKDVCPSLQYVKIGEYTWQIVPKWCEEKSFWDGFRYVFIEQDEELKIEFLSYNTFAEHCGLIEAAQPHERMGDDEMVAMEKLMSDALAAQRVARSEHGDTPDEISDDSEGSDTDSDTDSEDSWEGFGEAAMEDFFAEEGQTEDEADSTDGNDTTDSE